MTGIAQPSADIAVGEPLQEISAIEYCAEQLAVVTSQRVQAFRGSTGHASNPAGAAIKFADLDRRIVDDSKRVEVAGVCAMRDIAIADQLRDTFAHTWDAQMPQIEEIRDEFALELSEQFASQEAHDLSGARASQAIADQTG